MFVVCWGWAAAAKFHESRTQVGQEADPTERNDPREAFDPVFVAPRNDVDENGVDRRRVKVVIDSGDGEAVTLF